MTNGSIELPLPRGEREGLFGSREREGKMKITFLFYGKGTGKLKRHASLRVRFGLNKFWAQLTNLRDQPPCRPTWLPLCWPPCLTKNNFCRLPCATTCQPRTKIKTKILSAAMSAIMRRKYGFGLIGGLGVSVAPRVKTPGDKILSGYVVSRPLRPK